MTSHLPMRVSVDGAGRAVVVADCRLDAGQLEEAIRRLSMAYFRIAGVLPPVVSFRSLGVDKLEVTRARAKNRRTFSGAVAKVRGGA